MHGKTIWIYGISGAGKTTIANQLKKRLYPIVHLDGDEVRQTLCADLSFTYMDRERNVKRVAQVAQLLNQQGIDVVVSLITPLKSYRTLVKNTITNVTLVYLDCSLNTVKTNDVKGLYAKAVSGEISNFTTIDSKFEIGDDADIVVATHSCSIDDSVNCITNGSTKKIDYQI